MKLACLITLLTLSLPAFAEELIPVVGNAKRHVTEHGLSFGFRSGYGAPAGTAGEGWSESDLIKGMFPLWLDAGYRFNSNLYLGGFVQYGFGLSPSSCSGVVTCSSIRDLRFGLNLHYHFLPGETVEPWLGIGAGYEILSGTVSANILGIPFETSQSARGFEFANLQAGLDWRISPTFRAGPWVGFSLAQYSEHTSDDVSRDVADKSIHHWLMFGLRGTFNLNFQ